MAPRMVSTAEKTAKKTAKPSPRSGVALPVGAHAANTGGKPGRSGRLPSVVREAMREAFADRIYLLEAFADDASLSVSDRLRALEQLARYGLGATTTQTDPDGNGHLSVQVVHTIVDPQTETPEIVEVLHLPAYPPRD
jgi:hypothetical protein